MQRCVLAVGLDPVFADFTKFPQLMPELIRSFIDTQLAKLRDVGYDVTSCLVDTGNTAESVLTRHLQSRQFDCVMFGAGLRDVERLLLFEKLLNLVHVMAPNASICFNTNPADTVEAVQRWV